MIEKKPKLIIPREHWDTLQAYVALCPVEITGFCDVEWNSEGEGFIVTKVYLLNQKAQAAEVDMEEEQVAIFMDELMSQGATQMPRLWWHSHADMDAFFSGTDDQTQTQLANDSYFLALVMNKDGKSKANLNVWEPFPFQVEDLEIVVEPVVQMIPKDIQDEYEKKVEIVKETTTVHYSGKGVYDDDDQKEVPAWVNNGIQQTRYLPKNRGKAQSLIDKHGIYRVIGENYACENYDVHGTEWIDLYWTNNTKPLKYKRYIYTEPEKLK